MSLNDRFRMFRKKEPASQEPPKYVPPSKIKQAAVSQTRQPKALKIRWGARI